MATTLQDVHYSTMLSAISCGVCSIPFAIPASMLTKVKQTGDDFFCPNGHKIHYFDTENKKLTKRLAAEERARAWAESALQAQRDQTRATERSLAAYKGHLTRARNKIAQGNCPVADCGQHFSNVREHMKFKHPEWHLIDPETGKAAEL